MWNAVVITGVTSVFILAAQRNTQNVSNSRVLVMFNLQIHDVHVKQALRFCSKNHWFL